MAKKTKKKSRSKQPRPAPPQKKKGVKHPWDPKQSGNWYNKEIKKPERYTLKQRMFIQEYLRTGNASEAYRIAYDGNPKNASVAASQLIHKPKIAKAINAALEAANFTEDFAARTLKRVVESGSTGKNLKKATPANAIAGLRLFAEIKGYMDDQKEDIKQTLVQEYQKKTIHELKDEINKLNNREQELLKILQGSAVDGELANEN